MKRKRRQTSGLIPVGAIVKLHRAGQSPRRIAKKTGCDRTTVESVIAEYKTNKRPPGGPR